MAGHLELGIISIGNYTFPARVGIGESFMIPILSKVPWGGLLGLNKDNMLWPFIPKETPKIFSYYLG